MNVYFLKVKKGKRDWDTESVFSGCLKIFIKYLQQFYRIFTFIPHNGFLITVNECTFLFSASRSLHPHQPRVWLLHTPHLRAAQTLKLRCRVHAVRTRSLREAACTCVDINVRPTLELKISCELRLAKNLLAQRPSENRESVFRWPLFHFRQRI